MVGPSKIKRDFISLRRYAFGRATPAAITYILRRKLVAYGSSSSVHTSEQNVPEEQ